jgi:hypothetical protein
MHEGLPRRFLKEVRVNQIFRRRTADRMRDMKSDWKRWSRAERISAMTFVVLSFAIFGFLNL